MTIVTPSRAGEQLDEQVVMSPRTSLADKIWAVVRVSLGWMFLWAFVDKTFALGFSTGRVGRYPILR